MKIKCLILFFVASLTISSCAKRGVDDAEFTTGSKITLSEYSKQDVESLVLLGKIWGFLKYYHPAVGRGEYNWDFELFRIMPSVLNAKSEGERYKVLRRWIDGIGDFKLQRDTLNVAAEMIKISPDISWIDDEVALGRISADLIKIKNAERDTVHHYIKLATGIGNPIFQNENSYIAMSYPDTGYRLLALFRYWNIIQFYFPYKNLIDGNWNDVLTEFIPQFIDAKNEMEYKLSLLKLIAKVSDTHANIWGDDAIERYRGMRSALLKIQFIENKAIIVKSFDEKIEKGDIILEINNEPVENIVAQSLSYTPASNYATQLRNIASSLLRTNADSIYLKFERGNKLLSDSIKCYSLRDASGYLFKEDVDSVYQILPVAPKNGSVCYINLKGNAQGTIPNNIAAEAMVIDLRGYPNSSKIKGYWDFDQLYSQPTAFCKFTYGSLRYPGLFMFTEAMKAGRYNENYFKGKKIILVNEDTQSHAEFVTMKYRCTPNTIVIGSTTAGADGNVSSIPLPGGVYTKISGIGVYYPDGTETQRIGIVPDVEVRPTIKGFREGRDEVLEKAIEIIQKS